MAPATKTPPTAIGDMVEVLASLFEGLLLRTIRNPARPQPRGAAHPDRHQRPARPAGLSWHQHPLRLTNAWRSLDQKDGANCIAPRDSKNHNNVPTETQMNRLLACAAAALLLGACASTEKELTDKGMQPVAAAKVQTPLSGNTTTGTTASGSGFMIYNAPTAPCAARAATAATPAPGKSPPTASIATSGKPGAGGARQCARLTLRWTAKSATSRTATTAGRYKIEQGNPYKL